MVLFTFVNSGREQKNFFSELKPFVLMVFSSSLQILCILLCNYSTTTYCFVSNWLMRFSLLAYSQYVFVHHLDRILFRLVPHNEILRLYLYIKWNHLSVVFFLLFYDVCAFSPVYLEFSSFNPCFVYRRV